VREVGRSQLADNRAGVTRDRPSGHLYVDDNLGGAVYEFPLNRRGLPRSSPDRELTGFQYPEGLAIGPDGDLYVSDSVNAVKVFAPGASGNAAPTRVLNTPGQPEGLRVDAHGYLAVIINNLYVLVYAPHAAGSDLPIEKLDPNGVQDLAYNSESVLYYLTQVHGIGTATNLPNEAPAAPARWILPTRQEWLFEFALATDEADDLYVEFHNNRTSDIVRTAVIRAHATGKAKPDREIITPACHGQRGGSFAIAYGIAIHKGLLFQSCSVLVADFVYSAAQGGVQQPLATLRAPFLSTGAIAIGP